MRVPRREGRRLGGALRVAWASSRYTPTGEDLDRIGPVFYREGAGKLARREQRERRYEPLHFTWPALVGSRHLWRHIHNGEGPMKGRVTLGSHAVLSGMLALLSAPAVAEPPRDCGGPHVGTWVGATVPGAVAMDASCRYELVAPGCRSRGYYAAPLGREGTIRIEIVATAGKQCLPAGSHTCAYAFNSSGLAFDCGGGIVAYRRSR